MRWANAKNGDNAQLTIGDIHIDFSEKKVEISRQTISLTPIEYKLLSYMSLNEGKTLSWEHLLKEVWGHDYWHGGNKLVKVNIGRLRKKIEKYLPEQEYITTVWGMGYKLSAPQDG